MMPSAAKSGPSSSSKLPQTSTTGFSVPYLKSYPYLFVRETDQTDYFCTLCDAYLKEEDLQTHLFEGHQAENIDDYFVRVNSEAGNNFRSDDHLFICVVCWAKIHKFQDTTLHRKNCKVDPSDEDLENGSVPMSDLSSKPSRMASMVPTNVVSTPDIVNLVDSPDTNGQPNGNLDQPIKRGRKKMPSLPESPLPFAQAAAQCMQCTLCSAVIPIQRQLIHLRDYHRITCQIEDISCPLCLNQVSLLDLGAHMNTVHNANPISTINSLLFWIMSLKGPKLLTTEDLTKPKLNLLAPSTLQDHLQQSKLNHLLTAPLKAKSMDMAPNLLSNGNSPHIPTVLQTLLSKTEAVQQQLSSTPPAQSATTPQSSLATVENIMSKVTLCRGESIQCLICSKWYATPPVLHLRIHLNKFAEEQRRIIPLNSGNHVCIICYDIFDSLINANHHLVQEHKISLNEIQLEVGDRQHQSLDIPTVITTSQFNNSSISNNNSSNDNNSQKPKKVELDNAGRVKSGKVRKQCELCGEWSNIKWFFKHMSEVHQALFCRCCREYLPIHEHEEHKRWHSEPPYMGQKIRLEHGQPVIIDRKERASLTPIGSLASWGGSSGGKVVKAVDTGPVQPKAKKRKANSTNNNNPMENPSKAMFSPSQSFIGHMDYSEGSQRLPNAVKDTLMPKETCPVCGILITYKNLARHIKLRHKIKYKFCHKCRKLVPNTTYQEHRNSCNEIVIDGPVPDDDMDKSDDLIDPTEFLDASSPITVDANEASFGELEDSNGSLNANDSRKSEEFRATTSKNKLESLLGKEFKHPRRRCVICGYTVSYSNFKRHLRNAHPAQYKESETSGDFRSALATLSDEVDEEQTMAFIGHAMEVDIEDDMEDIMTKEEKELFTECSKCKDQILKDYLPKHMSINHPNDSDEENKLVIEDSADAEEKRECPVCQDPVNISEMLKHCKDAHKTTYKWCAPCQKYIVKKEYRTHLQEKHDDPNFASDEKEESGEERSRTQEDQEGLQL